MTPKARLAFTATLLASSVLLAGCGGIQLQGKIFDAMGVSDIGAKKPDPHVDERSDLVVPPSTAALPAPGSNKVAASSVDQQLPNDPVKVAAAQAAAEQAERLTGEIMNLALRECFVKIDNQRPVRTRTADLPPAFRSDYFRRVAMPIYRTTALARSPYVFPAAEVDAQIAQRKVLPPAPPPPEPNFSPEPFPFLDSPHEFARDFIAKKRSDPAPKPTPRSKTKKPPTKKYPPFTVIPGGLDGDNDRDG